MTPFRTALVAAGALALAFTASPAGQTSTAQQHNDAVVARLTAEIAGHEREPSGQVFENVQYLKNTEARTLLNIMDIGYARALGVTCDYCHDERDFASDEKRPKKAAREMQAMHRAFNDSLRAMKNLTSEVDDRPITCYTCHRGQIKPFRG
jgi:ABC-type transporter MlaC component